MRIILRTIPAEEIRYSTAGDWYWDNGDLIVECPDHECEDSQFALLLHELVEAYLCKRRGISEEDVSGWDKDHPDSCEPAEEKGSPYRSEHETATIVEKIVVQALGMVWEDHNEKIGEMADSVDAKKADSP